MDEAEANFLRAKLQGFLSRNPEADVKAGGRDPAVVRPWGEDAIEIALRADDQDLLEALNSVRLPPRFIAIWHDDTREFEIIYTVVTEEFELVDREFDFRFREHTYRCQFGPSSARLRSIARAARPTGAISRTGLRNLQIFYRYEHSLEEHPDTHLVQSGKPTSFWIRGISDYDDDRVGELVRNLNFHMSYYDRNTPTVVVVEEAAGFSENIDSSHHHGISFPSSLSGKDIDQHLLILWESAKTGDPFLRFIHYYQILEYAGFYHIKEKVRREVQRAMTAPDAASRPDVVARKMLDALTADRRQDEVKISELIEECVEPREMWEALDGGLAAFSEEIELDGGFILPTVISASASYEEFSQSWNRQFAIALHRVRNALVHARESRQATMIAPTTANHARLSPWLLPLSQTAARVMLYSNL